MKYFILRLFFIAFGSFLITNQLQAQDTLPKFTATIRGNRVIISWTNPYENLIQVAVQRSYDSLRKYNTVYSAPSPQLPVNGFSEQATPGVKVYYRIFYVLSGGNYFFSRPKLPALSIASSGTDNTPNTPNEQRRDKATDIITDMRNPDRKIFVKVEDTLYASLLEGAYFKLRDSIIHQTKDTLYPIAADTILIKRYVMPYSWTPSKYVFTDRNGNLRINLADASDKQYEVSISEDDGTVVLDLKQLKEPLLFVDKTNFYHAGWYKFNLYENGKLKEKGRFLLDKEF